MKFDKNNQFDDEFDPLCGGYSQFANLSGLQKRQNRSVMVEGDFVTIDN